MNTKELLALKQGMVAFLEEMPFSIPSIENVINFAHGIDTLSTFIIAAMLQDKEFKRLDQADGVLAVELSDRFDVVMVNLEKYIVSLSDDEEMEPGEF